VKKSKLIKRFCLYCKKEFYTYPSQNCKFCSRSCSGEAKAKIIPSLINLNKNLSYVLGVLCGDGYLSKDKKSTCEIGLRTIDKDFALTFKSNLQKTFDLYPVIKIIPPSIHKIRGKLYKCKKQFKVIIFSKRIYNSLLKFDAIGKFKTKIWRVPKEITNSKNEKIIGMFLRGFLDSEATPREYCIEIASSNKKGLNDIKYLLSKLGIRRFYFYKDWKNVWKLIISGKDNLFLIYQKIGFTIERKQKVLKNSVEYRCKIRNFKKSDYWDAIKFRMSGYTYREISDMLKINTDTVRGWCKRGNMPYDIQRQIEIEGI